MNTSVLGLKVALIAAAFHGPAHHHWVLGSEYGPRDSGGPLACHGRAKGIPARLDYSTVGVANRTLPCGSRLWVRVRPGRRWLRVRVIDRGPYAGGRSFDLTWRTARLAGVRYPWSGAMEWGR